MIALPVLPFLGSVVCSQNLFWKRLPGPYGGNCRVVVARGSTDLYAGGLFRIYRSSDHGSSWKAARQINDVSDLVFGKDGTLFASCGKLFRSSDGAESWTQSDIGVNSSYVYKLAVNSEGVLFVGGTYPPIMSAMLYYSVDNGYHWYGMMGGSDRYDYVSLLAVNPFNDDLFVGTRWPGIGRIPTRGMSRQKKMLIEKDKVLSARADSGIDECYVRAMAFDSSGLIYAGTTKGVIFRSDDEGSTWEQISARTDSGSIKSILVSPLDGHTLYCAVLGRSVFVSVDSGKSWSRSDNGLTDVKVMTLAADAEGELFAGTWGSGVFASNDYGSSWQQRNIGMSVSGDIAVGPDGAVYVGTENSGIFTSTDHGETWARIDSGIPNSYLGSLYSSIMSPIYVDRRNSVFVGVQYYDSTVYTPLNYLFRSTDRGRRWQGFQINDSDYVPPVQSIAKDEEHGILYAGLLRDGVYSSTDNGEQWSQRRIAAWTSVEELIVLTHTLFASVIGRDTLTRGLFRSSDTGASWKRVTTARQGRPHSMAKNSRGTIFIANGLRMYRSSDLGDTWQEIGSGIVGWPAKSLAVTSNDEIFATVYSNVVGMYDTTIYHSTDNGDSWHGVSNGLEGGPYGNLAIDSAGYVYVSTLFGNAALYRSVEPRITGSIRDNIPLPTEFLITQNYPNPFNPSTTISYSLPHAEHVSLTIYDVLGREIVTLVNEKKEAGSYEITWNGINSPSGIYLCRMRSGEYGETRKLLLLR